MSEANHVDMRLKVICDIVMRDIAKPTYIESRLMMSDLLSEASPAPRMVEQREQYNVSKRWVASGEKRTYSAMTEEEYMKILFKRHNEHHLGIGVYNLLISSCLRLQ
uniref:AlNc14C133G7024 protein n=1 Tax=Albugo laibachii Nc14 TaxID=890382 RepID=F0WKH4_9STRA|nr:AlNc14C133G7024 [Albugo laibachii Nc14]|eukprot:CCA21778.1 AlNc14C133G7024 [Albugo laibachii Nc14]